MQLIAQYTFFNEVITFILGFCSTLTHCNNDLFLGTRILKWYWLNVVFLKVVIKLCPHIYNYQEDLLYRTKKWMMFNSNTDFIKVGSSAACIVVHYISLGWIWIFFQVLTRVFYIGLKCHDQLPTPPPHIHMNLKGPNGFTFIGQAGF